jgi:hypothetical protein
VGVVAMSGQSNRTVGGSKDTSLKEYSDELYSSGVQFTYYRRKENILLLVGDILNIQTSPLLQ